MCERVCACVKESARECARVAHLHRGGVCVGCCVCVGYSRSACGCLESRSGCGCLEIKEWVWVCGNQGVGVGVTARDRIYTHGQTPGVCVYE